MNHTTQNIFDLFEFSALEKKILNTIMICSEEIHIPVYVIGGFVRDKILGRYHKKDIDFVCDGDGIAFAQYAASKFKHTTEVQIFKNYGTAHFKFSQIDLEFVGARKESYELTSRNPFVESGTLEDDQNRRDFTINALAVSLNKEDYGNIIDPFDGLNDLKNNIIRTPLSADITFNDDPLRMLRAIRFAAQLQFNIEEQTFEGIKKTAERISIISQERITEEINKIMLSDFPSTGIILLDESGLLKIIFPELEKLKGVEMQDGKGHKDNFYHTLEVLDNISLTTNDLWLRWAALLHDIAKPSTKKFHHQAGWTFHNHEVVGAKMVKKIFARMRLPLDAKMKFVEKMVLLHLRPISLSNENVTDSAIRRLLFEAGEDIDKLMLLCEADITTKNRMKIKRYMDNFEMVRLKLKEIEQKDRITNFQPPVSGQLIMDVLNLEPGKEVGEIKEYLKDAILDGLIPNEYEAAYQLMLNKAIEMGILSKP